jgi:ribosomal protein S18 acetylase RimI-like enzyme
MGPTKPPAPPRTRAARLGGSGPPAGANSIRLAGVPNNADRRDAWPTFNELDPGSFARHLDALIEVYAAAMHVPELQLPGRRAVMQAHGVNPAFRGLAVTARSGRRGVDTVAFAYGFHGARGQWWHDLVRSELTVKAGPGAAGQWLDDSFEVAEVHVRPDYQQRGIGRRLLFQLTGGLAERTAVLSTMDAETPARRLYRSLGFTDLLTGYQFAGVTECYAVMGAALPLLGAGSAAPAAVPPAAVPPAAGRPPSPRN